jgi:hypothetical protein
VCNMSCSAKIANSYPSSAAKEGKREKSKQEKVTKFFPNEEGRDGARGEGRIGKFTKPATCIEEKKLLKKETSFSIRKKKKKHQSGKYGKRKRDRQRVRHFILDARFFSFQVSSLSEKTEIKRREDIIINEKAFSFKSTAPNFFDLNTQV